ncbi:hypothetical protein [Piscinibacter sp. XHJ-5]|uniref:hypothetical protein n=1 Tax=Piscinibacter sp. XHJ-5 TaxID=3037797 RepID=UPI0024528732|nr:hypothetical protein [Piscinibacter sp. XHJ-5]
MASEVDGTHQHAKSGKLYTYQAEYSVAGADIRWRAKVQQGEDLCATPDGTIATGTPAAEAFAEQAVRDAVVTAIDLLEDSAGL